ncbi:hypothetical protein Stsp02_27670 [Streptomyces sp. NBRC 14336]|nr:hypothetical protein Stsp02_27670 [Streptomyces sp. NBRC 14336]
MRGSPVTRTRPVGGTEPVARRVHIAPCAYTTTASRADAHRGVFPEFMSLTPVMMPVPAEA